MHPKDKLLLKLELFEEKSSLEIIRLRDQVRILDPNFKFRIMGFQTYR